MEKRVNGRLKKVFKEEDARIQSVVKMDKENVDSENHDEVNELTRKAQLTLLRNQKYSLVGESLGTMTSKWKRRHP